MAGRRIQRRRRQGALLIEVSVAAVIAAVATVGVVQLVLVANGQLRKRENQALLVREVGNLMEDLFSRSWEELSAAQPPDVQLSEQLRQRIPDAKLQLDIKPEDDRPTTLRISIRVESSHLSNLTTGSVQLVAWRERIGEEKP
jgi:Tfp pilus assembly protein PilV